ncbi:hypothetical protein LTR78_009448 [Recurvomyces mirabilis]|uniref:Uncharacterized protein n=1 Tax=Recurvomyces mirabilis TaxID=574656 RepID=A0AAE0WIL2_9PEZI|nr:hypothetical protein LTR78_009448 [Recurvomyces mirabilis]KAK5152353.1 hypothetical protein LTS14_008300 [Recurvomyces mirabilis]
MAKLQFDDLPEDIKILRPTDLKSVCLVNKQLHTLAVRPLYRYIALDLGSANDARLSAFLSPSNIGLKHIRQIRLYLANVRDRCNQKQQASFATRMLLEFLPNDILEEFSWCPWESFDKDNLLLLYRRQRRMKWLEVMNLNKDVLPELKKNVKMQEGIFAYTRTLALYPENLKSLELCKFFVQKAAKRVEELIVHAHFDMHDRDHSPPRPVADVVDARELNDSATGPGILTRTMFAHLMPFEKCTPFAKLTSLRLHCLNLRHCAETWCKVVDFNRLQILRLYQCAGADSLFGQMSKATHLPRELKMLEFVHKDNDENEALIALDGFLCLVSGLRHMIIDLEHVKALPAAAGIVRHSKTLEMLNVHASDENNNPITSTSDDSEEHVWSVEDFEKICKACSRLEQLSCAWPQSSLIRAPTESWKSFESAVVTNLKGVVTLHMSTFPSNKPSTQLLPRAVYEQLLQGLATRLFSIAATGGAKSDVGSAASTTNTNEDNEDEQPTAADAEAISSSSATTETKPNKLRLLAFGISDKIYEREESKNQILYLRSSCKTALGEEKPYAAPITWNMRQFVEPRSEVLEFVLQRESRVPCKDSPGTGSGLGMGGHAWGEDDE